MPAEQPGPLEQPHYSIVGSFWRWADKPLKIMDFCVMMPPVDHEYCIHRGEPKLEERYYYIEWKMRQGDGIIPMDSYITEQEIYEADKI